MSSEKKYFTHCDCEKCGKLSELLDELIPAIEAAAKRVEEIEGHTPLGYVLGAFKDILQNMFKGNVMGVRMASAQSAALADFIQRDAIVQSLRSDMVDTILEALPALVSGASGPQLMSVPLEDAPEEIQTMVKSIIGRGGKGGGSNNYH